MHFQSNISDQELINLCLDGDDKGYTALYNRYTKRIYNAIYRIVSHTAEAEDLLQDTFFTVFSEIEKLSAINNLESWLKRVAINRAISHLRKKKISFEEMDQEIADEPQYDQDEEAIFDCRVSDVREEIEKLPQGYKTILCLYVFEDISQEEIAKMLNISHNTVRTQYHRARKKIISSIKERSYYE